MKTLSFRLLRRFAAVLRPALATRATIGPDALFV